MARIPKKAAVTRALGLPSKEQMLLSPENTDKVPAHVSSPEGQPMGPAALTEGEFVFSIPAIIGLGDGNYEQGLSILTEMHDQLKAEGEALAGEQGLGAVE